MTALQIEIYHHFRALGLSESRALKATASFNRRQDFASMRARLRNLYFISGAALILAMLAGIFA